MLKLVLHIQVRNTQKKSVFFKHKFSEKQYARLSHTANATN